MSDISGMRTSARLAPVVTLTIGIAALLAVLGFGAWPARAATCADPTGLTCATTTTTTAPPATQPSIPPIPSTTTTTAPPRQPPSSLRAAAAHLLELVNSDRAGASLPPVAARGDVEAIAVDHSFAMARSGSIWHNDDYFTEATRARLGATALGENVASNRDIDDANRRLMASPGHRANLLDPRFSVIGIGVVDDGTGYLYITEDFVAPISAPRVVAAAAPHHPSPGPVRAAAAPSSPAPAVVDVTPAAAGDVAPTPVTLGAVPAGRPAAHHHRTPLLPMSIGLLLVIAVTVGGFSSVGRGR